MRMVCEEYDGILSKEMVLKAGGCPNPHLTYNLL